MSFIPNNQIISVVPPGDFDKQAEPAYKVEEGLASLTGINVLKTVGTKTYGGETPQENEDVSQSLLPVACYTDFKYARRQRPLENTTVWMCELITPHKAHTLQYVLSVNAAVQFKLNPAGQEDRWYRVESVVPTPSLFPGGVANIEVMLVQLPGDFDGSTAP